MPFIANYIINMLSIPTTWYGNSDFLLQSVTNQPVFTSLVELWQIQRQKIEKMARVYIKYLWLEILLYLSSIIPVFAIGSFANKQIVRLQETPDAIPEGETPHTVSLCLYNTMVDAAKPGDRVEVWDLHVLLHEIYHCRILDLHWLILLCIVLRIFVLTLTLSRNGSNNYLLSS